MNRRRMGIVAGIAVCVAGAAYADNVRFHSGVFRGQWCDGNQVIYHVTNARGVRSWNGRMQNGSALDRIRIDQLSDGSLRIVRTLTGASEGQTQQILTRPAAIRIFDGETYAQYWADSGTGPSCRGHNADLRMPYVAR